MKRRILNPYNKLSEHKCFACSDHNPIGLKLEFYEEDEYLKAEWIPKPQYQGYYQVVHGGIQSTLMDEVGSWCCQIKLKRAGVTRNLNVKYRKPLYINQESVSIQAKLIEFRRSIAKVEIQIIDSNGIICSSAVAEFFMLTEGISKEKFYYPEYNEFFE